MRHILYCFACILLAGTLRAQTPELKPQIKLTAEQLAAKTKASYFTFRSLRIGQVTDTPCVRVIPCSRTSTTLPVKLVRFSGERIDEANVSLFWETSEEVNNDYFQIERTVDPRRGFQSVATVEGAGTAAASKKYQISDPNDHSGYTYYRLKQVDFDGTFEYSSVIAVKGAVVPLSITAFPNPGQSKNLLFKVNGLHDASEIKIVIYNAGGTVVYQDDNLPVESDEQNLKLDLKDLSTGKYSIKVNALDQQTTGSFVVIP